MTTTARTTERPGGLSGIREAPTTFAPCIYVPAPSHNPPTLAFCESQNPADRSKSNHPISVRTVHLTMLSYESDPKLVAKKQDFTSFHPHNYHVSAYAYADIADIVVLR